MIWRRWREVGPGGGDTAPEPFADLLEQAPVPALLVDAEHRVYAANEAARAMFAIDPATLPRHLVEVTREGRLEAALTAGLQDAEIRLIHRQQVVRTRAVPGPRPGDRLLFVADISDLKRLETVRQEFVANLSHELKTPLTSLRLAAETLTTDPPAPVRDRMAQRVIQEADQLAAVVDNLRRLAEIEGGGARAELAPVALRDLLRECAERVPEREVDVAAPAGLAARGDRAMLAQAVGNLLDNAARHSPPGAHIELSARAEGREAVIEVRDHGPGIAPEHWDRVFERFYKVDSARTRRPGGAGTGLGLAITRNLVALQGGRAWTTTHRDGGQVFGIALPLHDG